jgi:hypothetical protein
MKGRIEAIGCCIRLNIRYNVQEKSLMPAPRFYVLLLLIKNELSWHEEYPEFLHYSTY